MSLIEMRKAQESTHLQTGFPEGEMERVLDKGKRPRGLGRLGLRVLDYHRQSVTNKNCVDLQVGLPRSFISESAGTP